MLSLGLGWVQDRLGLGLWLVIWLRTVRFSLSIGSYGLSRGYLCSHYAVLAVCIASFETKYNGKRVLSCW